MLSAAGGASARSTTISLAGSAGLQRYKALQTSSPSLGMDEPFGRGQDQVARARKSSASCRAFFSPKVKIGAGQDRGASPTRFKGFKGLVDGKYGNLPRRRLHGGHHRGGSGREGPAPGEGAFDAVRIRRRSSTMAQHFCSSSFSPEQLLFNG